MGLALITRNDFFISLSRFYIQQESSMYTNESGVLVQVRRLRDPIWAIWGQNGTLALLRSANLPRSTALQFTHSCLAC